MMGHRCQAPRSAPPTSIASLYPAIHHGDGGGDQPAPSWQRAQSDSQPPNTGPANPLSPGLSFAIGTALHELQSAPPACRLRRKVVGAGHCAAPLAPNLASPPAPASILASIPTYPRNTAAAAAAAAAATATREIGFDTGGSLGASTGSVGGRTSWNIDSGIYLGGERQLSRDSLLLLQGETGHPSHGGRASDDELSFFEGHGRFSVSDAAKTLDDSGVCGLPPRIPSRQHGPRRSDRSNLACGGGGGSTPDDPDAVMNIWPQYGTFGGGQVEHSTRQDVALPPERDGDERTVAAEGDHINHGVMMHCDRELLAYNEVFLESDCDDDDDGAETRHMGHLCQPQPQSHWQTPSYPHPHPHHPDAQLPPPRLMRDVGVGEPGAWGGQAMFASQQSAPMPNGDPPPLPRQPVLTRTSRLRVMSTVW